MSTTQDIAVSQDTWTLVHTGGTTDALFVEVSGNNAIIRIEASLPATSVNDGHELNQGERARTVTLKSGENLYARGLRSDTVLIVTGE